MTHTGHRLGKKSFRTHVEQCLSSSSPFYLFWPFILLRGQRMIERNFQSSDAHCLHTVTLAKSIELSFLHKKQMFSMPIKHWNYKVHKALKLFCFVTWVSTARVTANLPKVSNHCQQRLQPTLHRPVLVLTCQSCAMEQSQEPYRWFELKALPSGTVFWSDCLLEQP